MENLFKKHLNIMHGKQFLFIVPWIISDDDDSSSDRNKKRRGSLENDKGERGLEERRTFYQVYLLCNRHLILRNYVMALI